MLSSGCRGKPAANKHRMDSELLNFAARLRELIATGGGGGLPTASGITEVNHGPLGRRVAQIESQGIFASGSRKRSDDHAPFDALRQRTAALRGWATRPDVGGYEGDFDGWARELFALQFRFNPAYQKICAARRVTPATVEHWTQIPAVPTAAFKELELSCLPAAERTAVFHSSGTTEQTPSRHFHGAESLALYEASLLAGWERSLGSGGRLVFLTPGRPAAPHSSLIYMFDTVRRRRALPESVFLGSLAGDGAWGVDFSAVLRELSSAVAAGQPLTLLGTAFSLVHLLDYLAEKDLRFRLPAGSRVMETGGYKNRSRSLPKAQLHALISDRLGVPAARIVCEYGMCELSSQAYTVINEANRETGMEFSPGGNPYVRPHPGLLPREKGNGSAASDAGDGISDFPPEVHGRGESSADSPEQPDGNGRMIPHSFHFPPWVRVQIISPETGCEVAEGGTGIIRVLDLANVFSVAAIQTGDLGIRRGDGFELLGRAESVEPRGCSLMAVNL